jgi:thiamine biosynthesis lipoprotein
MGASVLPRRRWLALAGGLLAAPLWPGLARAAAPGPLFGTPVDLLLPGRLPAGAEAALWQGLARIHQGWNAWKPGELLALNQALRQGQGLRVAPALRQVLQQSAALEVASQGLFNPSIGGLVGAWGFHADRLQPGPRPADSVLAPWQAAAPSLADLHWQGDRVHSRNPAVQLDLGAIGKGVAIDQALDGLQRRGASAALLNLGGNLAAMGSPGGRPWQVGIRHPLRPGLLATLATAGRESVVTSGCYERFRLVDGAPAVHILDPRRGTPLPARATAAALVSVTVVHPSAALADAAATALLVAGPARWPDIAARLGVAQVLVVDAQGRAQASPALAPRLHWV